MYKAVATQQLGRFELVRELGRGLDSSVYLAQDRAIERPVVIKLFGKGMLGREDLAARIRACADLSHIGIARIYGLEFTEPAGPPFLVTEFVEGDSLEALLSKGKLGQAEALSLTVELLDALSYAHSRGICHHNLKPSNLIVTPDGHLKLTDFIGMKTGSVTAFMAPEQLKGKGNQRSDLFSVGVLLYLMLSGYRPFQGNTDATIGFKLVHQHPVPVAAMDLDLSPEVDFVIGRLLSKSPEERYQTGEEAKQDIAKIKTAHAAGPESRERVNDAELLSSLMETIGFSAGRAQSTTERRSERYSGGTRFWKLAVPFSAAILVLIAIQATRPMLQAVPPAPLINPHVNLPGSSLPLTKTPVRDKSRVGRQSRIIRGNKAAAKSEVIPALIAVPIELRQPFEECRMSIWVDDNLAYNNVIKREKKSRFLHLGSSSAEYLTLVQMPPGTHDVKVEIRATDEPYDGNANISATFSKGSNPKLRITAEKSRPQLDITAN